MKNKLLIVGLVLCVVTPMPLYISFPTHIIIGIWLYKNWEKFV